ncbi:hypothetical protein [Psychrobacter frigidicola]|uniref:hypothetical protein n=1 Tax=Psychrobacter frigidicola TaxID=45611 RepID=UPI001918B65D|nr:hypothetical protein [Psychrobacter frigidicola]
MKNYKLLLAGLILLLLIILIGVFTWLWSSNRKNMDPLPITVSEHEQSTTDTEGDAKTTATSILYVQAEDEIQVPLDDVIIKFESRFPNVQVLAHYVPTKALFTLPDTRVSSNELSSLIDDIDVDVIIANDKITQTRLALLQNLIDNAQTERNQSQVNANGMRQESVVADSATSTETANNEARNLTSFSYATKDTHSVDGVILTNNPVAVSFRNFLLSSAGQDVLKNYDYDNIDGYKNSMDDLFNPSFRAKEARGQSSVKVADALSNGS